MKHLYNPHPLPRRLLGVALFAGLVLALAGADCIKTWLPLR